MKVLRQKWLKVRRAPLVALAVLTLPLAGMAETGTVDASKATEQSTEGAKQPEKSNGTETSSNQSAQPANEIATNSNKNPTQKSDTDDTQSGSQASETEGAHNGSQASETEGAQSAPPSKPNEQALKPAKAPPEYHRVTMRVSGSMCLSCLKDLETRLLQQVPGIVRVKVDKPQSNYYQPYSPDLTRYAPVTIVYDLSTLPYENMKGAIKMLGYFPYKIVDKAEDRTLEQIMSDKL